MVSRARCPDHKNLAGAVGRAARGPRAGEGQSVLRTPSAIGNQAMQRAVGAPPVVAETLATPGQPLSPGVSRWLGDRFGLDLSQIRVHADSRAAASARAVEARAYTVGRDIVFGRGQFAPESTAGRRLLAHEVAHTIQQGAHGAALQRSGSGSGSSGSADVELGGGSAAATDPVYMCSKPLDTSPLGSHAFFRTGAPGAGNPTVSLQPIDSSLGADCWQGIPGRNYESDLNAEGTCELTSMTVSCLDQELAAYPIGHYCTLGPNSNTFVGHVAKQCGISDPDPPGWTPGIDDSPPPSGTYAPDKWETLTGCTTKRCIIGPDDEGGSTRRA